MFSGLGKLGHGTSSRSSNRTSSKMADAGLKTSATALALTLEVIFAANAAPTSAGWLCALDPSSYTPLLRSDVGSTWVDLVKKKTFLTSLKSAFFFSKPLLIPFVPSLI